MLFSGVWGQTIHEKTWSKKSGDTVPLKLRSPKTCLSRSSPCWTIFLGYCPRHILSLRWSAAQSPENLPKNNNISKAEKSFVNRHQNDADPHTVSTTRFTHVRKYELFFFKPAMPASTILDSISNWNFLNKRIVYQLYHLLGNDTVPIRIRQNDGYPTLSGSGSGSTTLAEQKVEH
jgi:hypothetical protein